MVFQEEHDGQFSFFTDVEEVKVISPDITFVTFMKEEIKKFQSKLNSFVKYKNEESFGRLNALLKKDFEEFIAKFLDLYKLLPVEQILIIQENYSSEYHRLCRLFLEYLNRFVYNKNLLERLDDFEVIQIENLIMLDPVSFRDVFYRDIKGKIEKRKKLRVNHYLVIHGPALLERMNASFLNEDFAIPNLTQDVNALVYHMSVNDVFVHYDSDFIEKEQSGTLSMLLLYYLEKSVYHCLPTEDTLPRDMIEKIELYIVYHFSEQFQLLPNQEKTYEQVKMSVARRLSNYIKKNVAILKRQIKDYDTICKFQDSGKYQLVTEEAIDLLPNPVTEMELRMALETFLTTVFVLKNHLKNYNLPIFLDLVTEERHAAMLLGLEYLRRFAYHYSLNSPEIHLLEEYIYHENTLKTTDSSLCLTRSRLMANVGRRNAMGSSLSRRKTLQTREN